MKKAAVVVMICILAMTWCFSAMADVNFIRGNTEGNIISNEAGIDYTLLVGHPVDDEDAEMMVFRVLVGKGEDVAPFLLATYETNLMNALLDTGLGEVEPVSWGYSVTVMDQIRADYNVDASWWSIYVLKDGDLVPLETGVDATPVETGDMFVFMYTK